MGPASHLGGEEILLVLRKLECAQKSCNSPKCNYVPTKTMHSCLVKMIIVKEQTCAVLKCIISPSNIFAHMQLVYTGNMSCD